MENRGEASEMVRGRRGEGSEGTMARVRLGLVTPAGKRELEEGRKGNHGGERAFNSLRTLKK